MEQEVPCQSGTCCIYGGQQTITVSPAADDSTDHVELTRAQARAVAEHLLAWVDTLQELRETP